MPLRPSRIAGRPDQALLVTLALALLLLFALRLYVPPYHDAFLGDDYVQQWRIRDYLDSPQQAYELLSPAWTNWYYRPVQNLWFLGNRLVFGLEPFGYYYLGACVHLLAIALLYHVARRLGVGRKGGLTAAVIFGISAQHQLTVSWISSIGNVASQTLSLAGVALFLAYLRRPPRRWLLAATLLSFILALLAHEEGFVLPLFLAAVWYHRGRRPRPPELYAAAAAASLILGYAIMQFGRENVHVGIDAGFGRQLASGLLSTAYAPFLATFGSRLLQLDGLPAAQNLVAVFGRSPLPAGLFLLAAVALAAAWFRWGNRAVRLGLIWAGLHLAFIYASLWVQDPALVDSRHAFAALAGIALAVGGTLTQAIGERVARPGAFSPRTAWAAAAAGLLIFALVQAQGARRTAAGVEILMADLEQTEAQMKAILPQVTRDTKVFAHRFTLSAPYFAPAAAVWYAAPHLEGGDLAALQSYPRLTPDFYVFDQADGRLYDLMPEVRSHRETVLLWREPAVAAELIREGEPPLPFEAHDLAVMPGSAGESRFGIEVASPPGSTVSLTYRLDVPPGASLAFAISGVAGQTFRVRAQAADGAEAVVFEESLGGDSSEGWQEQLVTLTELGGQEVQFTLEVTGAAEPAVARWANPRLVLD